MDTKDTHVVPVDAEQELQPSTKALARRVIRKIDMRILMIMFVTYNFNFIDKTILSSAAVFGLTDDNHLVGTQYAWAGSIFYFGYVIKSSFCLLCMPRVIKTDERKLVIWSGNTQPPS